MTDFDWPRFLAARLDEHESSAEELPENYLRRDFELADVAAKRAILNDHHTAREMSWRLRARLDTVRVHEMHNIPVWEAELMVHTRDQITLEKVIQTLCRPFADHPDYPKEGR